MSQMAVRYKRVEPQEDDLVHRDAYLPLQLAAVAEATGGLIAQGLAGRVMDSRSLTDESGVLRPEIAPLALAYEAALLVGLSPQEVKTLRRLLSRVEAAALKLSGRR